MDKTRIQKLTELQSDAVDALEQANFNGSILLSIRSGK